METRRRKFSAEFKAKVVLEALREQETIEALPKRYELHPNQISAWKKEATANLKQVFERSSSTPHQEDQSEKLYAQIGQLKVENDRLKKSFCKIIARTSDDDRKGSVFESASSMPFTRCSPERVVLPSVPGEAGEFVIAAIA